MRASKSNSLLALIIASILLSCTYDDLFVAPARAVIGPGILGKWSVATDVYYTGTALQNHEVEYTGLPGDYYDFRTNRKLYIKEGLSFDTLSYTILSDTSIVIYGFGYLGNGLPPTLKISNFSEHNAVISSPFIGTPGGMFGRSVVLYR
ncbi:hypothetical protein WSM22_26530 [Cytophagales bacterium WSM2-2]|nr:hypothetical protein WSM22_26530 [Cytophagales bacterium WSM2-2]